MSTLKVVSSKLAAEIDKELMGPQIGFTLQQLMELAGFSVAQAVCRQFPLRGKTETEKGKHVFVIAGPGNNGGDGLVCARHLKLLVTTLLFSTPREASALNSTNSWFTN